VNVKKEEMERKETRYNEEFEDNDKASSSKGREAKQKLSKFIKKGNHHCRAEMNRKKEEEKREAQRQSSPAPAKKKGKKAKK